MQLHKLMRHVVPGAMHVVLAGRDDGVVGSVYTRAPVDWLLAVSDSFKITHHEIRASAAAARVVTAWRSRFSLEPQPGSLLPWFRVLFMDAVRALDEYNLTTGEIFTAIETQAPVRITGYAGAPRGKVIGFTRCGRVAVKLEGSPLVSNVCLVPRDAVELALEGPARARQA
jgi:hypothetical protein